MWEGTRDIAHTCIPQRALCSLHTWPSDRATHDLQQCYKLSPQTSAALRVPHRQHNFDPTLTVGRESRASYPTDNIYFTHPSTVPYAPPRLDHASIMVAWQNSIWSMEHYQTCSVWRSKHQAELGCGSSCKRKDEAPPWSPTTQPQPLNNAHQIITMGARSHPTNARNLSRPHHMQKVDGHPCRTLTCARGKRKALTVVRSKPLPTLTQ